MSSSACGIILGTTRRAYDDRHPPDAGKARHPRAVGISTASPLSWQFRMIKRICQHPECHQITTATRCPDHATPRTTQRVEQHKVERRARDGRNTARWQQTRQRVLRRDPVCQCGAPTTHAHYIPGGHHTNNLDDYLGMCARCHGRRHGRSQSQRRGGAVVA